eukprot:11316861-Alexandrium_andersonii.AAC.1
MSASLVGSEMCIRDRRPFSQSADSPSVWRTHSGCPHTRLRPNTAEAVPVSYTHLTLPTICSV